MRRAGAVKAARRDRRARAAAGGSAPLRAGPVRLVPALVAALTLALGVLGGTAYAYFGVTASGSGHGGVGAVQPISVEQATVVPGSLFPGGKAGLSLTLDNPNDRVLTLVGVAEIGTAVSVTPPTAACPGASVSVSPAVAGGLRDTLKARATGTGITTLVIPTGAVMSTTSPNACQSEAFHIGVTVRVRS